MASVRCIGAKTLTMLEFGDRVCNKDKDSFGNLENWPKKDCFKTESLSNSIIITIKAISLIIISNRRISVWTLLKIPLKGVPRRKWVWTIGTRWDRTSLNHLLQRSNNPMYKGNPMGWKVHSVIKQKCQKMLNQNLTKKGKV